MNKIANLDVVLNNGCAHESEKKCKNGRRKKFILQLVFHTRYNMWNVNILQKFIISLISYPLTLTLYSYNVATSFMIATFLSLAKCETVKWWGFFCD